MKVSCNLKKEDRVEVIAGKSRGKVGKVLRFEAKKDRLRVVVEGVNKVKRHTKPSAPGAPSGIIEKEAPLDVSNVALVCPKCNERTRVAHAFVDQPAGGGRKKVRVCKKCHEHIDGDE